jgi:hypothetical protein
MLASRLGYQRHQELRRTFLRKHAGVLIARPPDHQVKSALPTADAQKRKEKMRSQPSPTPRFHSSSRGEDLNLRPSGDRREDPLSALTGKPRFLRVSFAAD